MVESKEITSPAPTDAEAPTMYTHGVWLLGGIVALALVVLLVLGLLLREKLPGEVVTAIVAIAGPAVAGLAGMFARKA